MNPRIAATQDQPQSRKGLCSAQRPLLGDVASRQLRTVSTGPKQITTCQDFRHISSSSPPPTSYPGGLSPTAKRSPGHVGGGADVSNTSPPPSSFWLTLQDTEESHSLDLSRGTSQSLRVQANNPDSSHSKQRHITFPRLSLHRLQTHTGLAKIKIITFLYLKSVPLEAGVCVCVLVSLASFLCHQWLQKRPQACKSLSAAPASPSFD